MKSIDELKKIDLKEISTKTKIVQQRLKDIIEYNFDKIDRTRARGFIHILSREYKIDFDDWLEAYDNFYKEQEKILQSKDNPNELNNEKKETITTIVVDSTMKDKTYIRLVIALVILIVSFSAYFLYKNVFNANVNNIDNPSNTINIEANNAINDTLTPGVNIDSNLNTIDSINKNNNDLENVITNDNERVESLNNKEILLMENNLKDENVNLIEEITFIPKSPLWIGIIDLDTYRKKQLSISSNYKIILDKDKLIRTGHSHFNIIGPNNLLKKYIGGDNKYFLYTKESGLKEIKRDDFLSFNRGEDW